MIDLAAIKGRCKDVDRLLQEQPWLWLERQATPALKDRVELVAEVERLLEQAQRAEAAMREAVAREAALKKAVDWLWGFWDGNTLVAAASCNVEALNEAWDDLLTASMYPSQAAVTLLERLAELETQVTDLRGALQSVRMSLERAADALVPEARVAEAAALVEEALVAMREEIE